MTWQPEPGYPEPGPREPGHPEPGYPEPGPREPGYPSPGQPVPGHPEPGYPSPGQPVRGHPEPGYPSPGRLVPGPRAPGEPRTGRPGPGRPDAGYPQPGPPPLPGLGDIAPGYPPAVYSAPAPASRRGRRWAAMLTLLAVSLCGLAAGAAGAARQLLPREFSAAQQRQIETWEMTRRWRALPAGKIFPASVYYQVSPQAFEGTQGLQLTARRLGIAPQGSCAADVSAAAAAVLAAGHCVAVLRATYVDGSGSMAVTLGVAALPTPSAAMAAAQKLSAATRDPGLALRAFALAGTPAARFHDRQRQLSIAMGAGPYVILATAGFTDGRRHVQLASDDYYEQEMSSLANGLAESAANRLGAQPTPPTCPGAPGC